MKLVFVFHKFLACLLIYSSQPKLCIRLLKKMFRQLLASADYQNAKTKLMIALDRNGFNEYLREQLKKPKTVLLSLALGPFLSEELESTEAEARGEPADGEAQAAGQRAGLADGEAQAAGQRARPAGQRASRVASTLNEFRIRLRDFVNANVLGDRCDEKRLVQLLILDSIRTNLGIDRKMVVVADPAFRMEENRFIDAMGFELRQPLEIVIRWKPFKTVRFGKRSSKVKLERRLSKLEFRDELLEIEIPFNFQQISNHANILVYCPFLGQNLARSLARSIVRIAEPDIVNVIVISNPLVDYDAWMQEFPADMHRFYLARSFDPFLTLCVQSCSSEINQAEN